MFYAFNIFLGKVILMKKTLKRLLAVFMAATFLFSFPGCTTSKVQSTQSSANDSSVGSASGGDTTNGTDASGAEVSATGTSGSTGTSISGTLSTGSASSQGNSSSTSKGSSGGSSTTGKVGNGKVVVWGSSSDITLALAIANYKKKYPSINIKLTPSPLGTTLNSLKMAIMAGNGPDVVMLDHVYATSLGAEGVFADLSQYGSTKVKNLFTQSCYNANCVGSKVYALPWSANVVNLMYSKDLFNKAGLTSAPTNYTEFLADCKALKNKGYKAFSFPYGGPNSNKNWSAFMFFTWLWREGGDILGTNSKGKSVAAFNGTAGVNALNKLIDLYKQGYMSTGYTEDLGTGGAAMLQMGTWKIDMVSGANASKNGVAVVPRLETKVAPYSGLGLFSYCVSAKSQDPQAAYNFVELLCTDKSLQLKYNKKDFITPLISAQSDSSYTTGTDAAAWKVFFQQLAYSKFRPGVPGWEDIEKSISDGVYAAVTGKTSAQEALNASAAVVNSNLKRIYG